MRSWGIVLIIVGIGSYFLPLAGLQFKLVSLFGPNSGIIFIAIGVVLTGISFSGSAGKAKKPAMESEVRQDGPEGK
jgi:hypothetical protein